MIVTLSILAGLISMLGYGLANSFSKPLSHRYGVMQILFLREFTIVPILALMSIPSLHYLSHWQGAIGAIILGVLGYIPLLAFTHGVKESPLGIVAPIAGTSPLVTVILSYVLLHVSLHIGQWLAIVLIIVANVAISVDVRNWRQSNFLHRSSGVPYAIAASVGWGVFFFLLISVSATIGPWLAALFVEIGVGIGVFIHLLLAKKSLTLTHAIQPGIIANGVLICVATLAFTIGASYLNVGIVAALSNSTALITTAFGVLLFHERLHIKERVACAVMIIGVAALSLL